MSVTDQPLNMTLNSLNVEISFDDARLSGYRVTVSQTFASPADAIHYLLKDKPFKMERIGSVYVIFPYEQNATENPVIEPVAVRRRYVVSGELYDCTSGEPLPYAHIQTDAGFVTTDGLGRFSTVVDNNRLVRLQIRYLGYETIDTVLNTDNHAICLSALAMSFDEIVVTPTMSYMMMQMGGTSGEMRINHQIARYMPGSADNSVFTLLRMMPGVRASGEPSDDLIVWGSNWGESRLVFDGFTIFGMKNFNDHIGSVNPYMVKDIRLMRGGYGASQGNRTGAVADITGIEGDFGKPSLKANISNYTANIFASMPVKNNSALSVAYRQTFYNLYDEVFTGGSGSGGSGGGGRGSGRQTSTGSADYAGTLISPDYDFRDLNIKFAGRTPTNNRYHLSLYGSADRFNFGVTQSDYELNAAEENRQFGASAGYNKLWNSGITSSLLATVSQFSGTIDHVFNIGSNPDVFSIDNTIREITVTAEHGLNIGRRQRIKIGAQWQQYASSANDAKARINNPTIYLIDNIMLGKLSVQAGARADWIVNDKMYLQPRISARYTVNDELTATASWGKYRQFVARVPYAYQTGSYQMLWSLSESSFLSSTHYLAGLAYSRNRWLLSVEGYIKDNKNQILYFDNAVNPHDNTVWGFDTHIRKEWGKQTFFGSHSFLKASKPHTLTANEIKFGTVNSFRNFHFSAMYVYGAGFAYYSTVELGQDRQQWQGPNQGQGGQGQGQGGQGQGQGGQGQGNNPNEPNNPNNPNEPGNPNEPANTTANTVFSEPYSRLDVSLAYKFQLRNFKIQAGVSALNVFDVQNIKYSYRISDQSNVYNIYTRAAPRTIAVFFEINF